MLSKYCLLLFAIVLEYSLNPAVLLHAQGDNPRGFVSIDCGLPKGSDYKESTTELYYKSDANLIDSGESKKLSAVPEEISDEKYLFTLRSFPRGKKNCYTFQPTPGRGNRYLIRATFLYGNYDSLNLLPTFDLTLGAETWSTIVIEDSSKVVRKEIIHVLSSDYVHVCLIKTGTSTPFISAIELRHLNDTESPYSAGSASLQTLRQQYCDKKDSREVFRYEDDIYDRRWTPKKFTKERQTTELDINNTSPSHVPKSALETVCVPDKVSDSLNNIKWETTNKADEFYVFMHFTETKKLDTNEFREFNIYINDELWYDQPVVPPYLGVTSIYTGRPKTGDDVYNIKIEKTENSTLQPIINAYEVYSAKNFSNNGTYDPDVSAILNIKSKYGVTKNWQGDPCEPQDFVWDGLICSYPSSDHSARITSLNLSASKLTGEILGSIVDLTQLKTLDLSHNNLKGQIPEFLSHLKLSVLNLEGNKFTGPVPAQLLENQKNGILLFSYDVSGDEKKNNKYIPIVVGTVLGSVFLAAIFFGLWIIRGRVMRVFKQSIKKPQENISDIEGKVRRFTYSQVLDITKNLHEKLGEGGFGEVYRGSVGDIQVAVKMLSESSDQGSREFQTEVSLLARVHHKNLTSMVGYCNEDTHMGIIYEYMAERNLEEYLSGNSKGISSWVERLQIALGAAQGLEYLHHGCKPAIIHRDVKTSNILLNQQFQAKLADFGLSEAYPAIGGTHISTVFFAGTNGYIDPESRKNNRLTEKTDVFSFGVVLLEMITGKRPLLGPEGNIGIAQWVGNNVQNGFITQEANHG
ncbi:probable LRR receptor-like serine/threonine-protein kinase At5g59680 isoform X2 [Daucus carota subsp. sativus]|uniref:probable LRR receptor-like serine/threonine-protein kinase At5g59680 isoform X2 n=1 Tax=Daucus carota subsp. sativus TaxID=79200 RepID=UPI003083A8AA